MYTIECKIIHRACACILRILIASSYNWQTLIINNWKRKLTIICIRLERAKSVYYIYVYIIIIVLILYLYVLSCVIRFRRIDREIFFLKVAVRWTVA